MTALPKEVAALLLHGVASQAAVQQTIGVSATRRLTASGQLVAAPGRLLLSPGDVSVWTPIAGTQLRSPAVVATARTAAWRYSAAPFDGRDCPSLDFVAVHHTRVPGARESKDLTRDDVHPFTGLRFASPARALIDLAVFIDDIDIVERVGESLIRLNFTTAAQVAGRLDKLRRRGRPGVALVDEFLRRHGDQPPTGSDLEVRYLQAARRLGFPDPTHRQFNVGDFRIDFAYDQDPLVLVEVDGAFVHANPDALIDDLRRQNVILRSRPVLLRFTTAEIDRRPSLIAEELGRWIYPTRRAAAS